MRYVLPGAVRVNEFLVVRTGRGNVLFTAEGVVKLARRLRAIPNGIVISLRNPMQTLQKTDSATVEEVFAVAVTQQLQSVYQRMVLVRIL